MSWENKGTNTQGPGTYTYTFDSTEQQKFRSQRESWIESLEIDDRNELLFEIEALLVSLDRFVRPGELRMLGTGNGLTGYKMELETAVRTLRRVLGLCRKLQTGSDTQAALFGRFVEQTILADRVRDQYLINKFQQDTPEQSFALLDATIEHLLQVGNGLLKAPDIPSSVFFSFGITVKSVLYSSRFFNPFYQRGFSQLFDRIDHPLIVRAISQPVQEDVRKAVGLMVLSCMRLLRYLHMIPTHSLDIAELRDTLPLFALVRSDLQAMTPVFRQKIPEALQPWRDEEPLAEALLHLTDTLTFQFDMEGAKVFDHVLRSAAVVQKRETLLYAVETAHGILTNFVQQSVVWIVQALVPDVQGRDVFPDFTSRKEQSMRLREDVWILEKVLSIFLDQLQQPEADDNVQETTSSVIDYINYFQTYALKHVRAGDLSSFRSLCDSVRTICGRDLLDKDERERALFELHKHQVFLDTTLRCISQRSDLQEVALDTEHATQILQQFVPSVLLH